MVINNVKHLLLLFLLLVSCQDALIRDEIELTSDNKLLAEAINLNCKYILSDWWYTPKDIAFQPTSYIPDFRPLSAEQQQEITRSLQSFKQWQTEDYLFLPNWPKSECSEQAILPSCYACRVISSALYYGMYDDRIVGISKEEATKKVVLLISSLVKYHCSNSEKGWGNCWQGALWAEMVGMSAFLMKDYLPNETWVMVCNMIRSECEYVVNYAGVTAYKDRSGKIIHEGDSQSETVAWNATVLALAITMFPEDASQKKWRDHFIELNISAMACPSDLHSNNYIDGYSFLNLPGSNINDDGTVINHGKVHIDYMASPIESFAESSIALSFSKDNPVFYCLMYNVNKVYNALVELDLGAFDIAKSGHHFYERTSQGKVSYLTNMPEVNEWGSNRQANYYLVDTYVSLIGADTDLPADIQADKWAHCRLIKIVDMVNRDSSGRIYQDGEENFASGQLYAMACLTQVYSLLKMR